MGAACVEVLEQAIVVGAAGVRVGRGRPDDEDGQTGDEAAPESRQCGCPQVARSVPDDSRDDCRTGKCDEKWQEHPSLEDGRRGKSEEPPCTDGKASEEPEATSSDQLLADAAREQHREHRVGEEREEKDDHGSPEVRLGVQAGVLNEAVANERKGDECAPDNDGTQTGAAGFGRLDTYSTGSPCAPEAEPPVCPPSLDVIELAEHRLPPIKAIGRETSNREGEQLPRSIRPDPTSTETRAIAGAPNSAARTRSAKRNTAAMTHLEAQVDAACVAAAVREEQQRERVPTHPPSSGRDGEAADPSAAFPPTSHPAMPGRKDARGSGTATPTVARSPAQARSHTATWEGRPPKPQGPSQFAETGGGHEPYRNSTYIEIEVKPATQLDTAAEGRPRSHSAWVKTSASRLGQCSGMSHENGRT